MQTTAIDKEMNDYFMQLNENEKESVVQLIKTFVSGRNEPISIEQYNKELDEANKEIENGNSYTHDEVVSISNEWLNGK